MKLRKIFAGMSALAVAATMAITAAAEEYKGQILIQTDAWSYRNKMQDDTYGGAGDAATWDGKFICWVDNVATDWNEVTDDTPVAFEDVKIDKDGTYTAKMTGDLTNNCGSLNILGVSTNLPRSNKDKEATFEDQDIKISDVSVKVDGKDFTIPGDGKAILDADTPDFINILVGNQWNGALGQFEACPAKSIEITFTVTGLDAPASTDPEPSKDPAPTTDPEPSKDPAPSTDPAPATPAATPTGASAGLALAGLALAGAAIVVSKRK